MRKTKRVMLLAFVIMISMMSCNSEELFVELVEEAQIVEEEVEPEVEEEGVNNEDEGTEPDTSLPCEFTLEAIQSGDTFIINCILDLQGQTINLPANVSIEYEGGDIINGTLNFSENSIISGELLNSTLTLNGLIPQLKEPTFQFLPERWGIVEGVVSDDIALTNKNSIKQTINLVKELGGYTFNIDNIDAYVNVSPTKGFNRHDVEASIIIPSNFHLKMGDNCNLRVQPNNFAKTVLLYSRSTENITISGGKLWGDRYTHNYEPGTDFFSAVDGISHEWGHIIMFRGVHNSIIDGVEMHEGSGDGFVVGGTAHRNNDGSLKPDGRESFNVTVKNCLINDNRRNNISIVDGTNIYFEYNTITNSGSGDASAGISSNGTSPRAGIDIEAYKNNAPDNNSVYDWEKTENIHIRNNIFEDNYAGAIALYNGENTYVYENTFRGKGGIGVAYSFNCKIYNNTFERPEGLMTGSQAINLEPRYWANGNHRIIDFEVYGNTITGYQFAIIAGGQGHTFKDNIITDCQRGVILIESKDLVFDNNIISSNVDQSYGYYTFSGGSSVINCLIKNEEISVQNRDIIFSNINNNTGDITMDNIACNSGGIFLNSAQNITIKNSTFNDIKIINCDPILVNNN